MEIPRDLCMGCMSLKAEGRKCPYCGFDADNVFKSPFVLAFGSVLYGDRYLIGRVLGKPGVFGISYMAWDIYTETRAVIREYFPAVCVSRAPGSIFPALHSNEDKALFAYGLEQFITEGKKLRDFRHPCLLRVRDIFEENQTAYMVMNYQEGKPLTRLLSSVGGFLEWEKACKIVYHLLDGVKTLHASGYIHHDINPKGIMCTDVDAMPVIMGFSAAKLSFFKKLFGVSEAAFSSYSALENYVSSMRKGPWTDIYSCGAVLYKMITGDDPASAPERLISNTLDFSGGHASSIPEALRKVIARSLSIDASERIHSADQFQELLRPFINEQVFSISETEESLQQSLESEYYDEAGLNEARLIETKTNLGRMAAFKKIVLSAFFAFLLLISVVYVAFNNDVGFSFFSLKKNGSNQDNDNQKDDSHESGFLGPNGMKFVYLQPGEYVMGSSSSEIARDEDEEAHKAIIKKGFFMQTTEVTQAQWSAVMGANPSSFKSCGQDCPVESISWESAQVFIQRLNENSSDYVFRLPTEDEWEYACRAGTTTSLYNGNMVISDDKNASLIGDIGWYGGNSCVGYGTAFDCTTWVNREKDCNNCGTHPVAMKEPNVWGLYDMIGNVSEWCSDWYKEYNSENNEKAIESESNNKVYRGGAWYFDARFCRAASRSKAPQTSRYFFLGFRLVAERKSDLSQ